MGDSVLEWCWSVMKRAALSFEFADAKPPSWLCHSLPFPLRSRCVSRLPLNTKINSPRLFLHVFDTANLAMSTTIGGSTVMDVPGTVMENFSVLGKGLRWSDWHRAVSKVVEPRSVRSLAVHSERVSKRSFRRYLHLARPATL